MTVLASASQSPQLTHRRKHTIYYQVDSGPVLYNDHLEKIHDDQPQTEDHMNMT